MYETPLDELKPKLEALGLRVDTENVYYENDAEVYLGDDLICTLHYSEAEDGWDFVPSPPIYSDAANVINGVKWELAHGREKKKCVTFTVTIEYGADAPAPTAKSEKALAALVAKSITKLVPAKPKPKTVVVNGRRHSLRRVKASRI